MFKKKNTTILKNAKVLTLNDSVREFLKLMHFAEIEPEVTHLVIENDGTMHQLTDFPIAGIAVPHVAFMSYTVFSKQNIKITTE